MAKKSKDEPERVVVVIATNGVRYDGRDVPRNARLRMLPHEAADLVASRCAYYPKPEPVQ